MALSLSVVTGANRGIGLALTEQLSKRGGTVIAACRKRSAGLDKLGVEVVAGVDVTESSGIETLVRALGDRTVDLLIHNAGILLWGDSLEALDVDGIRKQFEVNALGPLRLTAALRARLQRGSKIAMITSRMGSIEDNSSGGAYGYRMSKAALNMAAKSIAEDLRPAGIAVAVLHPGMVRTEMTGTHGQVEPSDSATGLLARIDSLTIANSGSFWHQNGQQLPW